MSLAVVDDEQTAITDAQLRDAFDVIRAAYPATDGLRDALWQSHITYWQTWLTLKRKRARGECALSAAEIRDEAERAAEGRNACDEGAPFDINHP